MEPAEQRISDQERQQVAEVLRQAAGEGRIDVDELGKRLEATFAAKTYAEIVPITADLPSASIGGLPVPRSGALGSRASPRELVRDDVDDAAPRPVAGGRAARGVRPDGRRGTGPA